MSDRDIALMERHRTAEPAFVDLTTDEEAEAIETLMRRDVRFREAMVAKGTEIAAEMGLSLLDALEE